MPPKRPAPAASESSKKPKPTHACDVCGKTYTHKGDLSRHVRDVHEGKEHRCKYEQCDKSYSAASGLYTHVQRVHKGRTFLCPDSGYERISGLTTKESITIANMQAAARSTKPRLSSPIMSNPHTKEYGIFALIPTATPSNISLADHIESVHTGIGLPCPYDDCPRIFSTTGGLNGHVNSVHIGTRYPCPCADCGRLFTLKSSQAAHIKSIHGTPEDAAELREKRLQIRRLLADKEAQGICSATKTCQNPAVKDVFCCEYHQKTVDSVAKALKEKSEAGTLSDFSIKTAEEFALLLQRQVIYVDSQANSALRLLAHGLDDVQIASKSFAIDTEFCWAGGYVVMDITIERMNGEEVVSTRVDLGMDVEELRSLCSANPISQNSVRKVYGKSDKT
ncbi:zinc finger protein 41-like isoform X1 [Diaporthe amygdali]|uniref:zinc finger protein 41-like isoform X1 n=1 Tax=Phomopsis amygdali TaxID=1214568 RepID=UPI0022FF2EA9|nr:zinc finger protein 41-like isoform X1 [Diaporthe amygdali]KAJ0123440.1 zinc finger protein 41-like isoform X1 [Diaporthe amygdali]